MLNACVLMTSQLRYDAKDASVTCSRCRAIVGSGQTGNRLSTTPNPTWNGTSKASRDGAGLAAVKIFTQSVDVAPVNMEATLPRGPDSVSVQCINLEAVAVEPAVQLNNVHVTLQQL